MSERLSVVLTSLQMHEVRGIYGESGDRLPARMRYLEPCAAASFRTLGAVVVSDMFRSAEASLLARRRKRGSKRPGYSGHNYGLSIDLDVNRSMAELGFRRKAELDDYMANAGWLCHRRDSRRAAEDWHYNHGVRAFVRSGDQRTSHALERRIKALYGERFKLDPFEVQLRLAELRLYGGSIDGIHGPLTTTAIRSFQRAWSLSPDGIAGPMTQRVLSYVTSQRAVT